MFQPQPGPMRIEYEGFYCTTGSLNWNWHLTSHEIAEMIFKILYLCLINNLYRENRSTLFTKYGLSIKCVEVSPVTKIVHFYFF